MRSTPLALAAVLATTGCASVVQPEPVPPSWCDDQGWTERPFVTEGAFGVLRRDLADDFALDTHQGQFWFLDRFTGCETYLFVPDSLVVSPLDNTPLVHSEADLGGLLAKSPRNVHYFFLAEDGSASEVEGFVEAMVERIDGVLDDLDDDAAADWWRDRLHVVTEPVNEIGGWVDDAMDTAGRGFGIDRFQQIRGIGQLADVTRYSPALNNAGAWPWEANLAYVAHEAQYYNYRSDQQDRLDAVDWTSRYLVYDEHLAATGRNRPWVDLPDAQTMAGFDTLLVDLRHLCDPREQEFGNCDAWDAGNRLHLCSVEDPDQCDDLVARWITTYHREGRWLVDASEALPRLRQGGAHRFSYNGARNGVFITVRLLFANTGKGAEPFRIDPLWTGGGWSETYNEDHAPMTIDVPADAERVHLSVTLTGHGMTDVHNCAEFCDHQHTFTVGGESYLAAHPDMGDQQGCLSHAGRVRHADVRHQLRRAGVRGVDQPADVGDVLALSAPSSKLRCASCPAGRRRASCPSPSPGRPSRRWRAGRCPRPPRARPRPPRARPWRRPDPDPRRPRRRTPRSRLGLRRPGRTRGRPRRRGACPRTGTPARPAAPT